MKTLPEILRKIDALPEESARANALAVMPEPYPRALKLVLRHAMDPNIKHRDIFKDLNYEKCRDDNPGALLHEAKRLYLFVEGNAKGISDDKLKRIFEQILSTLIPDDAEFLISVMRKKLPYKNIDKKVVNRAFPGLI